MKSLYLDIKSLLTERQMDEGEARAIALLLLEKVCGMTTTEVLMNAPKGEAHRQVLTQMAERVAKGEPVQYVLGEADFCGMSIKVRPGVLIPRKETEELVNWIVESLHPNHQLSTVNCQLSTIKCQLLDIGTGSGCIAVALAKRLENTEVEAWDVSEVALQVAKENAERHGVRVEVNRVDVLSPLNPQPSTATTSLSATLPTFVKKRKRRWKGMCWSTNPLWRFSCPTRILCSSTGGLRI